MSLNETPPIVKPDGNLRVHINKSELEKEVVAFIKAIPNYPVLKNEIEICIYICEQIENKIKKGVKFDKKACALTIYGSIFMLTNEEKEFIAKTIDYVCSKNLIKKYSKTYHACKRLSKFFLKI